MKNRGDNTPIFVVENYLLTATGYVRYNVHNDKNKFMCWSFAIVNNRLAEVFFDEKKNGQVKIRGHCYVKREEYKTKIEQKYIEKDTSKIRIVYRNKKYKIIKPKASHN